MKTALINGTRVDLKFVRDDQIDTMSTAVLYAGWRLEAVSIRVYTPVAPQIPGIPGYRVLVLCGANGSDIRRSATPITEGEYRRLLDIRPGLRHTAMIEMCGGENLLKLA
ncbi:hypothetical protein [Thiolapillus sp.]|uniref:hypothetical protein n=1 Tax=Thiolapillus sp. TaxID=2017437 RepID=UPI003AF61BC6